MSPRRETFLARCSNPDEDMPALRFGAVADVQYADVEDAWNFRKTERRRHRNALVCLRSAVSEWARDPRIDFVADLGDMIDQLCETKGDSHEALARVLHEWAPLADRTLHLLGNHELYNFDRKDCAKLIPNITPWYRSFRPVAGWRIIVLDPYELNIIERGGGPDVERGMAYLSKHNPNNLRAPRGSVDLAEGLTGLQRRFLPMGGGVSDEQLRWLRDELGSARASGERVIVFTHVPVHPDSAVAAGLLWNYDEVLGVFREASNTVALVLAGHFHAGGYGLDAESGTHHVTLPSPLGASLEDPRAHCIVEVWDDRIEIRGRGLVPCRTLRLPRLAVPSPAVMARL